MKLFRPHTLATPQLRKKKRRIIYVRIGVLAVFLCAIVYGLSALSKLKAFSVQEIIPTGNSIITDRNIQAVAEKELEGNFFYLFSKRNAVLYPRQQINDAVLREFPIFTHVEVSLKGSTKLEIVVTERKPAALWCENASSCFLMDRAGYVYLPAPEFKGNPYVKYFGALEEEASSTPVGLSYLPGKLPRLMQFIEGVRGLKLSPWELYAKENGDYELYISGGGKILFTGESNLSDTLINLGTILEDDIAGGDSTKIDYIDLRYGNRVFYKLRGGVQIES